MGKILIITRSWTLLGKLKHYLFECPTFWTLRPKFECPVCSARYRCYWDGNDVGGLVDVCKECAYQYNAQGGWNETVGAGKTTTTT